MKKHLLINLLLLMLNGFLSKPAAPSPPRSSSLHDAIDKLSIVARVTNAIVIQKGLNDKSMKVDNLLDELLGIPPGDGVSNLQNLDLKKAKEGYIGISKDAGSLPKSSLNEAKNSQRLKSLADMGKDVEMLKTAESANLTDAIGKSKEALGKTSSLFSTSLKDVSKQLSVIFKASWTMTGIDALLQKDIESLKNNFDHLITSLSLAMNSDADLKPLWSFIGTPNMFDPLKQLSVAAKTYQQNFNEITLLTGDFKIMKGEFSQITPILKRYPQMKSMNLALSKSFNLLQKTLSNSSQEHIFTAGFVNGLKDVQSVLNDLNDEWFRDHIAVNNDNALNELKTFLADFKSASSSLDLLQTTLETIHKDSNLLKTLPTLISSFNSTIGKFWDIGELLKMEKSTSDIGSCIKNLAAIKVSLDFQVFNDTTSSLNSLDIAARKTQTLLKKIVELHIDGDGDVFRALRTEIEKINTNVSIIGFAKAQVDQMRANQKYMTIVEKVENASAYFDQIKSLGIAKIISNINKDLSIITSMQNVLTGTNLITGLECVKNMHFNVSLASEVLKFGSNIREFGIHAKGDIATISFFEKMSKLQYLYFSVKKAFNSNGKRTRRATGSIDPAKLPNLLASQDLGKGLNLLRQLSEVNNQKKTVTDVTKFSDSVFAEVQKVLKTVDTSSLKPELKKMLLDLKNLESFATNHTGQGLRELGAIFEKASEVSGVTVNSSLLEDPVAKTLSTSSVNDIKKAAPSFKTLGSLELNYANHRSTFKGASLSIMKIDEFFSDFFAAGGNIESDDSVLLYAAISIGGILLITIGDVAGYFGWRHIRYQTP